jgi:thioredoxin reductase (NADPH)
MTAAIYTSRALLKPLVFEGMMANGIAPGGQLTTTFSVENFPGFNEIGGSELTELFRKQAVHNGATIVTETVSRVDLSQRPFVITTEDGTVVQAETLIIATGAVARVPYEIPGVEKFWNHGISACAVCDGAAPIFRDQPIVVVGGGDSAMEEATFLTRYASHVFIVHRSDTFKASKIALQKARDNPKITFVPWSVLKMCQGSFSRLESVHLVHVQTQVETVIPASGLFFAIGHTPASKFLNNQLETDAHGYIVTQRDQSTSVPGVFAAGDVQDPVWRQAITSAGSGCVAALAVEKFLEQQ